MTASPTLSEGSYRDALRPLGLAFAAGFLGTFLFTFAALAWASVEGLLDYLVPAGMLLSPFSDAFAERNGLGTMLLTGVVNGGVYAAVALIVLGAVRALRQR